MNLLDSLRDECIELLRHERKSFIYMRIKTAL